MSTGAELVPNKKELAEHPGGSEPVVSDYENDGICLPAFVPELAGLLKVTADKLLV